MSKLLTLTLLVAIFCFAAFTDEWPPPTELIAYSGLPGMVDLSWNTPPPIYSTDTLAYDSGLSGGGDYASLDSGYFSVRFSPTSQCSVISIKAYFFAAGGDRSIRFHFWEITGLGYPDIYDNIVPPISDNTIFTGWNEIDVSSEGIVLDGLSDFYLGVEKRDAIPELGIAYDDTVGGEIRSYRTSFYSGGHFPTAGDLLIRATVIYLGDHSIATLTGTTGKIVTPIVPFPDTRNFIPRTPIPERFRERPIALAPSSATIPTSFTIFRTNTWSDPLSMSYLGEVAGSLTTFTDYSAIDGITYYYSVRADFAGGSSAFPDTVYATPYSGTAEILYDTFYFDDGVPDAGVHYENAVLANKFHLSTRCKLIRLQYHINTGSQGIPRVYLDNGGEPGEEILGEDTPYSLSSGWNNITASGYRVFVEGDFWVGIEMNLSLGLSLDVSSPGHAWDRSPEGVWEAISDTTYFIRAIVQYSTDNAYYHLHPGWNAISLPVIPSVGLLADAVFPFATGGEIYGWDADAQIWEEADMLQPGRGYMVLCPVDTFYAVNGIPIHEYSIPWAGPNWEFVGGLSDFGGIDTSDVTTTPGGLWDSPRIAYWWDAGTHRWNFSSKLMPSYAYFLLLIGDGLIEADE